MTWQAQSMSRFTTRNTLMLSCLRSIRRTAHRASDGRPSARNVRAARPASSVREHAWTIAFPTAASVNSTYRSPISSATPHSLSSRMVSTSIVSAGAPSTVHAPASSRYTRAMLVRPLHRSRASYLDGPRAQPRRHPARVGAPSVRSVTERRYTGRSCRRGQLKALQTVHPGSPPPDSRGVQVFASMDRQRRGDGLHLNPCLLT